MNRLHLYTGSGKGKTTAAMGLALRFLGHGGRVLVGQFLKDGTSGELSALRHLPGAEVLPCPAMTGFLPRMTEAERAAASAGQAAYLQSLICAVQELKPDCIILDELAAALALDAVPEEAARRLIDAALGCGETVVTGAFTPAWLQEKADYVTCMQAEKHPYQTEGLAARKGVEWKIRGSGAKCSGAFGCCLFIGGNVCYNQQDTTIREDSPMTTHWASIWGNAVSIAENRPERYAKNITIRYPIRVPFDGSAIRLTFDNYCGTEPVTINKTTLLAPPGSFGATPLGEGGVFRGDVFLPVSFGGERSVTIGAGENVTSDPVDVALHAGETVYVSFYLADFTLMRSVVFTCGKLSGGLYANGDETETADIDVNTSRATKLNYFLSNVSILTAQENRTIVCYGDSITAQDWPDDLQLRCAREGFGHTAIIRRAASGTRILREYSCLTYESYGMMGSRRFLHEVPTDGADTVIIQQGINDIIHPVGEDINIFRPMSDLPTVEELIDGLKTYIAQAREMGLKVYVGTLIPMGGWRTDAPFRQEMRHAYNDFIRTTDLIDGCIDFDAALRDPARPDWFLPEYDSGDHLHPSKKGYERMAAVVGAELLR